MSFSPISYHTYRIIVVQASFSFPFLSLFNYVIAPRLYFALCAFSFAQKREKDIFLSPLPPSNSAVRRTDDISLRLVNYGGGGILAINAGPERWSFTSYLSYCCHGQLLNKVKRQPKFI